MLAFAFAFVAGFVNTAAVLHAPSAGQLQLSERSPLTARRSQNSVMGASLSGRNWEDIVKDGFNRAATPAEFRQQIERVMLNDPEEVAHVLYSSGGLPEAIIDDLHFSDEAVAELDRRGYPTPRTATALDYHLRDMEVRTDPIALALFDEKGSKWCSGGIDLRMKAVPARFADFVWVENVSERFEIVCVDFDKAFRYGMGMIVDNEGSTMDDVRAWRAIVSAAERDVAPDLVTLERIYALRPRGPHVCLFSPHPTWGAACTLCVTCGRRVVSRAGLCVAHDSSSRVVCGACINDRRTNRRKL